MVIVAAATLFTITSAALARQGAPSASPTPSPGATTIQAIERREAGVNASLQLDVDHAFRSDLSDGPGDVSVTRAGLALDLSYGLSKQLILSAQVGTEFSWYSFKDATQIIPGTDKPFSQLLSVYIRPQFIYVYDEQWAFILGGQLTTSGESDVDVSGAFTGGLFGGVQYRVSESLNFTLGAGFTTRLEDSTSFIPFVGLEWKINDRTTLASRGPGLRLTHTIQDNLRFFAEGEYQFREFRLNDEAPLAQGVVRDSRIPLSVGVIWTAGDNLDVTFKVGAVVWQEFEIYNNLGNSLSKTNTSAAPLAAIGLDWKF